MVVRFRQNARKQITALYHDPVAPAFAEGSITPPVQKTPAPTPPASSSTQKAEIPADQVFEVTIEGTVNLQNYENLKVSVSGKVGHGAERHLYAELDHILGELGRTQPETREAIDSYRKRVLGGVV